MRFTANLFTTAAAAVLGLFSGRSVARSDDRRPPPFVKLVVLPPPYSSSIFPELDRVQRKALRRALQARYGCCEYCGRKFGKNSRVTIDHILPTSKGGSNTIDNLVVCCGPCNHIKSDRHPADAIQMFEATIQRLRSAVWTP